MNAKQRRILRRWNARMVNAIAYAKHGHMAGQPAPTHIDIAPHARWLVRLAGDNDYAPPKVTS